MPSLFTIVVLAAVGGGILYESRKMKQDSRHIPTNNFVSSHVENQGRVKQEVVVNEPSRLTLPRRTKIAVPDTFSDHSDYDTRATPGGVSAIIGERPKPDILFIEPQPIRLRDIPYRSNYY